MQYDILTEQARGILEAEPWYASAMSNLSALLMTSMDRLNWAGFYLVRNSGLTVGPFQGKPACVHIPAGKGVCGTAVEKDEIQNIPDVHQFPGHIACDSASNSEIVLPLHRDGRPAAVLDIDSTEFRRFSAEDEAGLVKIAEIIEKLVDWDNLFGL